MESSRERACPSCSAPADAAQRWCLECGAELPHPRRPGLRSAVGIATTLTVLVGAASAGGYTVLHEGKQAPPPATTVAQQPPPATTPPAATMPPATGEAPPTTGAPTPPIPGTGRGGTGIGGGGGATSNPPANTAPDLSDQLDTSTPPPPPPADDSGSGSDQSRGGGDGARQRRTAPPPKPRLVPTDIAFGAAAVTYAPYAAADVDLGDPTAVVDGTSRTAWKTPRSDDPAAIPQMGVYLDLASKEKLRKLVVDTPTPGMTVEVYGATSGPPRSITGSGWTHLATRSDMAARTTIALPSGADYRYVLIWVTGLPSGGDHAAISDVRLVSMQPE
jgi:hypothetical protein